MRNGCLPSSLPSRLRIMHYALLVFLFFGRQRRHRLRAVAVGADAGVAGAVDRLTAERAERATGVDHFLNALGERPELAGGRLATEGRAAFLVVVDGVDQQQEEALALVETERHLPHAELEAGIAAEGQRSLRSRSLRVHPQRLEPGELLL